MAKNSISPINLNSKMLVAVLTMLTSVLAMLVVTLVVPSMTSLDTRSEAAGGRWNSLRRYCPNVYTPVCGKNGMTYSNKCYALAAGMNVQCDGQCPCGGSPVVPTEEVPAVLPNEQGENPAGGNSMIACTDIYKPICATNGRTYGNECYATRAGATVQCEGQCPCGGTNRGTGPVMMR